MLRGCAYLWDRTLKGKRAQKLTKRVNGVEVRLAWAGSATEVASMPAGFMLRNRLRYEITVEDPAYLTKPATMAQQWDHRPDLEFSPASEACDPKEAARYRDHVPK